MKKIVLIFVILFSSLYATDIKYEMYQLYKNKQYKKACLLGYKNLKDYKRDEEFVSLYAFSCLYADYIDRLSAPAALLKQTPESRANSAYFAIIVMQKKLLYHALLDHYNLSAYVLPSTDYVLSKVFDAYAKLGKHKPQDSYIFKDTKDPKLSYKLYLIEENGTDKMVIEELYDTMLIKRHKYW
jgi:hypothetical protein